MKRYLVFIGDLYYPGGGWSDFRSDYDTLPQAVGRVVNECPYREGSFGFWCQIVDSEAGESGEVVFDFSGTKRTIRKYAAELLAQPTTV